MIIEVTEKTELARERELIGWIEDLADEMASCVIDDDYYERKIAIHRAELRQLRSTKLLYSPERLSAYEIHAIQGTEWLTNKNTGSRLFPKWFTMLTSSLALLMSVGNCIGAAAQNNLGLGLAGIILCLGAAALFALESPDIMVSYHNARIKRTRIDGIVAYRLDGQLANGLHLSLETEQWDRMIEALRETDREIETVFTTFCEGRTKYVQLLDQASKLFDINDSLENAERIDGIKRASQDFTKRTASEISEIFARRDVEAQVALQRAQDAQKRVQEEKDHQILVANIQRSMNEPIQGDLIDAELAIIESQY